MWDFGLQGKTGSHFRLDCGRGAPARDGMLSPLQFFTKLEGHKAGCTSRGQFESSQMCLRQQVSDLIVASRQEWVPGRITLKALGIWEMKGLSRGSQAWEPSRGKEREGRR